jgi:hypothetical protein
VAGAICALAGHPEFAPVLVAVGAAFLGLRTQVTPKGQAAQATAAAALAAATQVAGDLTAGTVGSVGEITDDAAKVISGAVQAATELVKK